MPIINPERFAVNADTLIELDELTNEASDAFINNATVTFAVKDQAGVTITNGTGSLTYVTDSDGKYQGVLDKLAALTAGVFYWLEITATSGTINGFWRVQRIAEYQD